MAISFSCPRCDRRYSVSDQMAGKRVTCKACGQEFSAPGGAVAPRPSAFDDDDDGPPIGMAPPPRTVNPASYAAPQAEPAPAPRPSARRPARTRGGSSGAGMPDWAPAAIKGVISLAVISAVAGLIYYVANNGLPSVETLQTIGVSQKAKDAVPVVKEYARLGNEMADLLGRVNDAESARSQASAMMALQVRLGENRAQLGALNALDASESRYVKETAGGDVVAALGRVKSEMQRLSSLPNRLGPLAQVNALVQLDREVAAWKDVRATFVGSAIGGRRPLTVEATGLESEAAVQAFSDKLKQIANSPGISWSGSLGQKYTFQITLDAETTPQDLANRIDFGKVSKTTSDTITVAASLSESDLSEHREKIAARKAEEEKNKANRDALLAQRDRFQKEREKQSEDRQRAEAASNTAPPLAKMVDANAGPIDRALADSRSSDRGTAREAVKRLGWGIPEDRRAEVAEALTPFLQMPDPFTASEAARSLTKLKAPESVPALIAVLDRDEAFINREAMKALGEIGDPRAAGPLADRMEKAWPVAQEALIALGPAAESAVMKKLRDPETRVRTIACEVLDKIGAKDTLKLMMSLPADSDALVRMKASETMRKIVDRVGPLAPSEMPKSAGSPFRRRK